MKTEHTDISWPGWETVRLIGRGSFGAVYEIQRDVLGDIEKAALKVISIPQNASDIDEMYSNGYDEESVTNTFKYHLKSIVAEYSMMRKLSDCPNIVTCDDVRYIQHDDGIGWDIYIKMELLTPLIKSLQSPVTEETAVKLAKDICSALVACKQENIVHRDIKPQNIFISPSGRYKLGDFGIAKTVEKTMGGTKIGTYTYMAPEVYNNKPYGSAADIYSLGLVLYWMLNERRMPFLPLPPTKLSVGMDEAARMHRLSGEQFPEPKHGSEKLKAIVMKACAYDPMDRFSSAQEMLDELNRIGQGSSVNAAPQQFNAAPLAPELYEEDRTVGVFASAAPKVAAIPDTQPEEDAEEETIGLFSKPAAKKIPAKSVVPEPVNQNEEPEEKTVSVETPQITVADNKKPSPIPEKKNSAESAPVPKKNKKKLSIIIGAVAAVIALVFGIIQIGDSLSTDTEPALSPAEMYGPIMRSDIITDYSEGEVLPVFGSEYTRDQIHTIHFRNTLKDAPADSWDISAMGNGSVKAWVDGADLYIAGNGGVEAPVNCDSLFGYYENVTHIFFTESFSTAKTTKMNNMFLNCSSLTGLYINGFDTSNVTDMSGMFANCSNLTVLYVSDFDTSNVTDMSDMFRGCSSLTSLDVKSFDTSNVQKMCGMFRDCTGLFVWEKTNQRYNTTSLDIRNWDLRKVADISQNVPFVAINGCSSKDIYIFGKPWRDYFK